MSDHDWLKRLLRSPEEDDRKAGMTLLVRTFQNPVASVLLSIARERRSATCSDLLDPESRHLDPEAYGEVWHETLACVWENVQGENFKFDGSLLAYLVTIAKRRAIDRWRNQRKVDGSVRVESLDYTPDEDVDRLLESIEQFCKSLSKKDEVRVREVAKIVRANGSSRGIKDQLAEALDRVCKEKGWGTMSATFALRQYKEHKVRLRNFLKERGHNV